MPVFLRHPRLLLCGLTLLGITTSLSGARGAARLPARHVWRPQFRSRARVAITTFTAALRRTPVGTRPARVSRPLALSAAAGTVVDPRLVPTVPVDQADATEPPPLPALRKAAAQKASAKYSGPAYDPAVPTAPPEFACAKGSNFSIATANARLTVLENNGKIAPTAAGAPQFVSLAALFAPVVNVPSVTWYQPQCYYDEVAQRFVVAALGADFTSQDQAWVVFAVSPAADPRVGNWNLVAMRTDLDGAASTGRWPDYLKLGCAGDFFVATFNEQEFGSNDFVQSRVRIFSRTALLSGVSSPAFVDFAGLTDSDNSPASSIVPCRHHGTNAAFYLVDSKPAQGTSIELWRLTGDAANPVLANTTVAIAGDGIVFPPYAAPPTARQPGVSDAGLPASIDTGDSRIRSAVADGDQIWTTLNSSTHWFSGKAETEGTVHWTQIDASQDKVIQSIAFGAPGYDYYDAALDTTAAKHPGVAFVFNRSGPTEGISLRTTTRNSKTPLLRLTTSKTLMTGGGKWDPQAPRDPLDPGGPSAWGPCSCVSRDPARPAQALAGGQYSLATVARDPHAWATKMGLVKP